MKKLSLLTTALLWASSALLGLAPALASHAQAGELTYYSLGNNQYRVRVTFFRDCGGIGAPSQFAFTARNVCSPGTATVTATLLPPPGYPNSPSSYTSFQPYCPNIAATQPTCTPTSSTAGTLTNTVAANFEAVVTLPPAAEWILSVEESSRPALANLNGTTLRLEATLNNLITPTNGGPAVTIQNNSPQFNTQTLPVPFVCVNQSTTLSFIASDVDRLNFGANGVGQPDSLVYSLERPLNGCGTYETYLAYPNVCVSGAISINPPCAVTCAPGVGTTYSATLPIAVANDTLGTCPNKLIYPRFRFNAQAGSFTFTPNRFLNTPSTNGDNKYVVVGKVTEYRRINGRYYKVGSVRRDFLVIVISCGVNGVPSTPIGQVADPLSQAVILQSADTTRLTVRTCNYSRVRFRFTDPNPGDQLTIFYPSDINSNYLQGGDIGSFALAGNGTTGPLGTFYFQPSVTAAGTHLVIPFRVEDNACPAKGIQYRTVIIDVVNGSALRIGAGATNLQGVPTATVCSGNGVLLTGNVQRPDSVRSLASGQVVAQVYNYEWRASRAAGQPVLSTGRLYTVTPATTTRYYLRVVPTLGFSPGCGDTTSVLVRVVQQPAAPSITRTGNSLTSSVAAGNQWYLNGTAIAGATGQTYVPTTSGSYTVVTNIGTPPLACSSPASASNTVVLGSRAAAPGTSLSLAPNPTPDGRLNLTLTGYRQPVTLAVFDALGRAVLTQTVAAPDPAGTVRTLELGAAAPGVYVLRVLTAGGVDVRRIVRE